MGGEWPVAVAQEDGVDVSRSHSMTTHPAQHHTHRPVSGDGVGNWLNVPKRVCAILICAEVTAAKHFVFAVELDVVDS